MTIDAPRRRARAWLWGLTVVVATFAVAAGDGPSGVRQAVAQPTAPRSATVLRDTDVHADRFVDAAVLGRLPAGAVVRVIAHDAGWTQIRAERLSGWVRAGQLRGDAPAVAAVSAGETGRSQVGAPVVLAGIRAVPRDDRFAWLVGLDADGEASTRRTAAALGVPQKQVLTGASWPAGGRASTAWPESLAATPGRARLMLVIGASASGDCATRVATLAGLAESFGALRGRLDKVLVVSERGAVDACDGGGDARRVLEAALARAEVADTHRASLALPGGSLARLADCVAGEATDADGSGGLSVAEVGACVGPGVLAGGATGLVLAPAAPASGAAAPDGAGAALLADLVAQRHADRPIEVTARQRLSIGRDPFELTIRSARSGHVYLLLLGSDGRSLYALFPNGWDADNRIEADRPLRLPRPHWQIKAGGPPGVDRLLVLVSDGPRPFPAALMPAVDAGAPVARLPDSAAARAAFQGWVEGDASAPTVPFGAALLAIEER